MAEKKLSIKLSLNDKQFQTGLRKASKSLTKFGSKMKRVGSGLSRSLTAPMAAFAAVSVKAFDEQIKSETKLRTALKGNEQAFINLKKQAQELQKVTLFGDEATIEAASYLAQLGLNESAISRLLPLIQDFATAQGVSLTDASKLVAKSVGSSTNALSRYGIQIEGAVGSQERLESAANALTTAFGGQAQAVAKEGLGPWIQLKNALGDVSEEFGKIILENIEPLKSALTGLVTKLQNLTTEQKEQIVKWGAIAAAIGPVIVILGTLISSLGQIIGLIRTLSAVALANPFVLLGTAATALVGVLGFAILDMEGFIKTALDLGKVGRLAAQSILGFANSVGLISTPDYVAAISVINSISNSQEDLEGKLTDSTDAIKEQDAALKKLLNTMNSGGGGGGKAPVPTRATPIAAGPISTSMGNPLTAVMPDNIGDTKSGIDEISDKFLDLGSTLESVFVQAMNSEENFFKSFISGMKQALKALAAQIAAMMIVKALLGGATGGTSLAAGGGLKGVLGGLNIPFLADGGIVNGATLSVIGEAGPEAVIPLNKLHQYGGAQTVNVVGKISGEDIVLSSDRYNRRAKRSF